MPKKKKKIEEAQLQSLQFPDERGGLTARISHTVIPVMAEQFVKLFKEMGGLNYVEFTMTSKKDEAFGPFTVSIQRHLGKTASEKASEFKSMCERAEKIIAELSPQCPWLSDWKALSNANPAVSKEIK